MIIGIDIKLVKFHVNFMQYFALLIQVIPFEWHV